MNTYKVHYQIIDDNDGTIDVIESISAASVGVLIGTLKAAIDDGDVKVISIEQI